MFILGWFTIPAEVFLRRDFGQRFFTMVSFYTGLLLLTIFAVTKYLIRQIWLFVMSFFYDLIREINPDYV